MGERTRVAMAVCLLLLLVLPTVAADDPKDVVCSDWLFILDHYILQPPAWADTEDDVAYAFQPMSPGSDLLHWDGILHFAGLCEIVEQILGCIQEKIESGGDPKDCIYWPEWPA